jgi:hypothetical protein
MRTTGIRAELNALRTMRLVEGETRTQYTGNTAQHRQIYEVNQREKARTGKYAGPLPVDVTKADDERRARREAREAREDKDDARRVRFDQARAAARETRVAKS